MEWIKKFWGTHGERLTFALLANGLGVGLYYMGMMGEAKTIWVGTAMLFFNKMRGNGNVK